MPNDANEVIRSIHRAEQKRLYGDMAVVGDPEPTPRDPIVLTGPGGDYLDADPDMPPLWFAVFLLFALVALVAALAWLWGSA